VVSVERLTFREGVLVQDEKRSKSSVGTPLVAMAALALVLGIGLAVAMRGGDARPVEALPGAKIDINTADAATLSALPSIGTTLSGRIVADRAANGPYARPEDLMRVKGVTAELVRRIEPFLVGFTGTEDQRPEAGT
jgi:hypothetical protein